jgi:WD40 repeat protein
MRSNHHKLGVVTFVFAIVCTPSAAQEKPPLYDVHGNPLPKGAIARLGPAKLEHPGQVHALVFSPDGKWLASAGADKVICVWDTRNGKALFRLKGHDGPVRCVAFVPSGAGRPPETLISGSEDMTIRFWDLKTGKEMARKIDHTGPVASLAVSKDGQLLAAGGSNQAGIFLWRFEDGKAIRHWYAHRGGVAGLAFFPDGKAIASGGQTHQPVTAKGKNPKDDYGVAIWDTGTGKARHTFPGHTKRVWAIALSADGKRLASSGMDDETQRSILLWDAVNEKLLISVDTPTTIERSLAISPDGKTLAGSDFRHVAVWDADTANEESNFRGLGTTPIEAIAFSHDGQRLASVDREGHIVLWDVAKREPYLPVKRKAISLERLTPDLPVKSKAINSVVVSPDGKIIATISADGTGCLWDRNTSGPLHQLDKEYAGSITGAAFSPDSHTLALSYVPSNLVFWNVKTGQIERKFENKDLNGILSLAYSPDGKWIAYENFYRPYASLLNVRNGQLVRTYPHGTAQFQRSGTSLAISPDGRYLASAFTNGMGVWSLHSGELVFQKEANGRSIAFSPGGFLLALAGEGVKVIDALNGVELIQLKGQVGYSRGHTVAFSPNGRLVAIAETTRVRLWDVLSKHEVPGFEGHKLTSVAFTPDGNALVSGSEDGTALIWDLIGVLPRLPAGDAKADWDHLSNSDRLSAYAAFCRLTASKEATVRIIKTYLKPTPQIPAERATDLLGKLDSENFQLRDQAFKELKKIGLAAEKALHQARKNNPSLETSRRLDLLIAEFARDANWRQAMIGVQLLEDFSTPPACAILESLSKGDPDSRLTEEAGAAWRRARERRK